MYGNPGLALFPEDEYSTDYKKLKPLFDKAKQSPILGLQFGNRDKTDVAIDAVYGEFVKKQNDNPQNPVKALAELNQTLKKAGLDTKLAEKQKQINAFISSNKK